jgi:hypothetical protein
MFPVPALPAVLIQHTAASPARIDVANMEGGGTLVMQLRAESGGTLGEGVLRYPPNRPQHQAIRNHLPGVRPGITVPVPPFP